MDLLSEVFCLFGVIKRGEVDVGILLFKFLDFFVETLLGDIVSRFAPHGVHVGQGGVVFNERASHVSKLLQLPAVRHVRIHVSLEFSQSLSGIPHRFQFAHSLSFIPQSRQVVGHVKVSMFHIPLHIHQNGLMVKESVLVFNLEHLRFVRMRKSDKGVTQILFVTFLNHLSYFGFLLARD